jgi:cell division septation protein DedD
MSAHPPPAASPPESATTALYRAALGPVHTAHYLAVFERFDEAGRASPVWNGAAGLLTLNWMVFRQLWRAALVYLVCGVGLAVLAVVLGRHFLRWPSGVEWGVLGTLLLLGIAIPGAYGHAILHADIRRRMTRAVGAAHTVREACAMLEKQASSKRRLWGLVAINVLLALGVGAAWLGQMPGMPASVTEASDTPAPAVPAVAPVVPVPSAGPAAEATAAQPATVSLPVPPAEPAAASEPVPVTVSPPVLPAPEPAATAAPPVPPPTPQNTAETPPVVAAPILAPRPETKAPARQARADDVPQAHGINVGLFADPANAEKAHARLVEAGLPAILQTVDSPKGARTRVRVGPFASRAQADAAAARIRAMGLDAVVFAP